MDSCQVSQGYYNPDYGDTIGSVSIFGTQGQNSFLQTKNPGITGRLRAAIFIFL